MDDVCRDWRWEVRPGGGKFTLATCETEVLLGGDCIQYNEILCLILCAALAAGLQSSRQVAGLCNAINSAPHCAKFSLAHTRFRPLDVI